MYVVWPQWKWHMFMVLRCIYCVQWPFFFGIGKNCVAGECVSVNLLCVTKWLGKHNLLKIQMQLALMFYVYPLTCLLFSIVPMMQLPSLHQGYFLTVSQLPPPWVMALCDSLSDSDEVMSEPRTKLSLLCPTETQSLLAFGAIEVPLFFFLSNLSFLRQNYPLHTLHAVGGRIHNTAVRQDEKKREGKRKNPLQHCLDSRSL